MAKKMKKLLALVLAVTTCFSMVVVPAHAASTEVTEYTVNLVPGTTTTNDQVVSDSTGKTTYTITATTDEVEVTTKQTIGEFVTPKSALKFDRNSSADQKAQQKIRDLYTDNGHFADPEAVVVPEGGPEGYPFYYGADANSIDYNNGDYSGHYVSHIRVIYERDEETGAAKVDENGNYIIKELQHSNGTPLTIDLQPTTSFEGPYDQTTGTRPNQFLLKDAAGNYVYTYCIDIDTGTAAKSWYAVANLEDNVYYASEESEAHVRGIVFNGYWGTEEGQTGSLSTLKAALKAALAAGKVQVEYDVNFRNRAKIADAIKNGIASKDEDGNIIVADEELYYASENYVYTKLYQHVTLTDEIIDGLTEGEALDAMQCAIWSWANGSNATLDGTDRMIVGDLYYASSAMGDSRNGVNDYEGAARTKALYQWLMQQTAESSTVIVNDKTFADNITLDVKAIGDGVYEASISFTIADFEVGSKDNLSVALTYDDAAGAPVTIEKALTGAGALEAENGVYTIDGLHLREGDPFNFSLNIFGEQYLEKNAYIYTAEGDYTNSQTMVGMAEGYIQIDVTKSYNSAFTTSKEFIPGGNIVVAKVDENGNPVTGASFELFDAEGKSLGEYEVDSNGKITFEGLIAGSYKLVETVTPDGYIGISEPVYFEVVRTAEGEFEAKDTYELHFPATAYEISNHSFYPAIPQTFVMLDAEDVEGWEYSEDADFRVVYCGDSETGGEDGVKYYRASLEEVYGDVAGKIRAIVENSYPYVSMVDMIDAAVAAGVADAANLTRGDLIAAVQLAIWNYTNGGGYTYRATYSVKGHPEWGYVFNDYEDELPDNLPKDTKNYWTDDASIARIDALFNYLINLPATADSDEFEAFAYVAEGGKSASQTMIGCDGVEFYTEGNVIFVENTTDELEDIEDPDVPLGPTPGGNENIEDEDVPKADVPKTGSMMMAAMSMAATSGAAMMFFRKKKD